MTARLAVLITAFVLLVGLSAAAQTAGDVRRSLAALDTAVDNSGDASLSAARQVWRAAESVYELHTRFRRERERRNAAYHAGVNSASSAYAELSNAYRRGAEQWEIDERREMFRDSQISALESNLPYMALVGMETRGVREDITILSRYFYSRSDSNGDYMTSRIAGLNAGVDDALRDLNRGTLRSFRRAARAMARAADRLADSEWASQLIDALRDAMNYDRQAYRIGRDTDQAVDAMWFAIDETYEELDF